MQTSLSFKAEFFVGRGPPGSEPGRPTSVKHALCALSEEEWDELARDVFGCAGEGLEVYTVMDRILETNTAVLQAREATEVWIDEEGSFRVKVYDGPLGER